MGICEGSIHCDSSTRSEVRREVLKGRGSRSGGGGGVMVKGG